MELIDWADFERVDLRVGTIRSAKPNSRARQPAYVLEVDLGPLGIKTSSAQLTGHYQPAELIGRQVLCVCNFPPKRVAGVRSDVLITGVGTGGHLTACAEVLKKTWSGMKAYAVEPTLSPVISGGQPGPHPIQGIGAGFIPSNLHTQAIDGAIQVDPEEAKEMARRCAREEGLLVGISSGATLAAIASKLADLPAGSRVLGFNYDTGERYLSVPDFLPE